MKNEGKVIGVVAEVGRELYEESVVARMEGRAGAYSPKGAPWLSEMIMSNDMYNMKDMFILYKKLKKLKLTRYKGASEKTGGKENERKSSKNCGRSSHKNCN